MFYNENALIVYWNTVTEAYIIHIMILYLTDICAKFQENVIFILRRTFKTLTADENFMFVFFPETWQAACIYPLRMKKTFGS